MPNNRSPYLPTEFDKASILRIVDAQQSAIKAFSRGMPDLRSVYAQLPDMSRFWASAKILEGITPQINSFTQSLATSSLNVLRPQAFRVISDVLERNKIAFTGMQEYLRSYLDGINKTLKDSLGPLLDLARAVGEADEVAADFQAYRLWLAPSMSPELVGKVSAMRRKGCSSATVHSVVSRYYARHNWSRLDECLERWRHNPLMAHRIRTLEQAVDAHKNGQYALVIPTLTNLIEGFAIDYIRASGIEVELRGQTRKIVCSALEDSNMVLTDLTSYAAVSSLLFYVENHLYRNIDFDKEYARLRRDNTLNGHAVRHGRQVTNDTRMNSLKLLLVVDALSLLQ